MVLFFLCQFNMRRNSMTADKNTKVNKNAKIIKTRIIVKPSYIGNKTSVDAFTEIIMDRLH